MEFSRREAIRSGAITSLGIGSTLTAKASTAYDIDMGVGATLDRFYRRGLWSRGFAQRSSGILVFPTIVKAGFGFGFGGEYGEGSLLTPGHTAEYYNTVSASFGFQLGAQARSVIIMFMTPDALEGFRMKDGWKVGVDGQPDRRFYLQSERAHVQSDA